MQATKEELKILTFSTGDLNLALPVADIQEVLEEADFQQVPIAPDYISGLFTLRGQIVTAIDLKKRFGLDGDGKSGFAIIVIKKDRETIGLIVNQVDGVTATNSNRIEELPANMKKKWQEWGASVTRINEEIYLLLKTEMIIN